MKKFQSFPTPLPPHAHTLLKCWSQFNIYFWKSMNLLLVLMYFIVRFCVCVCSIQFSSVIQSCLTFCDPMDCSTLGFLVLHYLPKVAQTHVLWVDDVINISSSVTPSPPPSVFPSIRIFSGDSAHCIRWPKYLSFSFSISTSNKYSQLTSFRIDWFDLLGIQGTLKSLFSTTVWKHLFFGTQPSLWSNSHNHTWLLEKP